MSPSQNLLMSRTTGQNELLSGIASLLDNGLYSDFIIECGVREWKVHKNIVCVEHPNSCAHFAQANSSEGRLSLPEDQPDAVNIMINYMYKADYPTDTTGNLPMSLLHVYVYTIADKYGLDRLKYLAYGRFVERATSHWACDEFADALEEIYNVETGEKQELRKEAIQICAKLPTQALSDALHEYSGSRIGGLARAVPSFGADLAYAMLSRPRQAGSNFYHQPFPFSRTQNKTGGTPDEPFAAFQATNLATGRVDRYQSITPMYPCHNKSFEELRLEDYLRGYGHAKGNLRLENFGGSGRTASSGSPFTFPSA